MKAGRAFFCIIQYAPVPGGVEARNIGLLLICSEFHFIQAKLLTGFRGIDSVIVPDGRSAKLEPAFDSGYQESGAARKSFQDLTELKDFIATLSDGITLSASSTRKVTDPAAELHSLYDLYVARQYRPMENRKQASPLSCLAG